MTYEHDGCKGCFYENLAGTDYPCIDCKLTMDSGTDTYDKAHDFWRPKETHGRGSGKTPAVMVCDFVNHPGHYTQGGIECIDAMQAAFGAAELATYCKIAAFKYIWRCEHKGGLEDVKKAIWHLEKFIELEGKKDG